MARGGKRPGSGRPRGPSADRFIRHALRKAGHSENGIWDKAVELAMDGNVPMITTLLKKFAPDLKATQAEVQVEGASLREVLEQLYH